MSNVPNQNVNKLVKKEKREEYQTIVLQAFRFALKNNEKRKERSMKNCANQMKYLFCFVIIFR